MFIYQLIYGFPFQKRRGLLWLCGLLATFLEVLIGMKEVNANLEELK